MPLHLQHLCLYLRAVTGAPVTPFQCAARGMYSICFRLCLAPPGISLRGYLRIYFFPVTAFSYSVGFVSAAFAFASATSSIIPPISETSNVFGEGFDEEQGVSLGYAALIVLFATTSGWLEPLILRQASG